MVIAPYVAEAIIREHKYRASSAMWCCLTGRRCNLAVIRRRYDQGRWLSAHGVA
jgi:hypothetical protein